MHFHSVTCGPALEKAQPACPRVSIVPSEPHANGREDNGCAIAASPLVRAGRDTAGLLQSVRQPLNAVALAVLRGLVEGQRISYEIQADRRTGAPARSPRPTSRPHIDRTATARLRAKPGLLDPPNFIFCYSHILCSTTLLEFRVCWAWLRQRSLFDRGVYGSWRAVDVGFEPLVMRRRRSRAGLYHEQGRFSCGLRARGGRPGYRGTGGQARP